MKITEFKIRKLHGYKNYDLKFNDNKLILVGENGAGKTTVLRMMFYLLTAQWNSLLKYDFEVISIKIDKKSLRFTKKDISQTFNFFDNESLRHFPSAIRRKIIEMQKHEGRISIAKLERICEQYGFPFEAVIQELESPEVDLFNELPDESNIQNNLRELRRYLGNNQILYLPTYRRIEQEIGSIFQGVDEDDFRKKRSRNSLFYRTRAQNHIELVEFGMSDVKESVIKTLEHLKEFTREKLNSLTLGYLGDVVDKKYDRVNVNKINAATEDTVKNILDRIDASILSIESKAHLLETIDNVKKNESLDVHAKVICHYFSKLLDFQQELEKKEENIRKFCMVCNKYMENKVFEYTSSSFSFNILPENRAIKKNIELHQLSSGEKQIVSLFSHLYLSNDSNFFVMIDEPELSLSVPWQRQFLVDISEGGFCVGLLAVTHSPFIYENDLEKYAHGIGEYMKQEDLK